VDDELHPGRGGGAVAKRVHGAELPGRVDMEQGERRRCRAERLAGEVKEHGAVLPRRIEHHRPLALGNAFAQDVDRLGLEPLEVGERHRLAP